MGFALGVAVFLLIRLLGGLNPDLCRGRTTTALLAPLLLGPGGLGFTATVWNRPRWRAVGLGVVVASLFPALFFSARDLSSLRGAGCAGGYVVYAEGGGRGTGEITMRAGETRTLTVRASGLNVPAGTLLTRAERLTPGGDVTLNTPAPGRTRPNEPLTFTLRAAPNAQLQTHTLTFTFTAPGGRAATGDLTVNVDAAGR
ncbi:hypothetical protein Deima_2855 [Deinococcus maricopensis DSM 21211]|uniref:Uncharacterized protein n=2 Tax=Deinococcus TaxID=1298 RepID=E8UBP5_DEIML|nr:hypothetical protein Deima_2855 [Deinococcus maricopensis DSM 21211]